jgi:hypothetical protein
VQATPHKLLEDAVEHYEDAANSAADRRCHAAFGSLKLASFNHGMAVGAAGRDRATLVAYRRVSEAAFRAEEEFAARCMKGRKP